MEINEKNINIGSSVDLLKNSVLNAGIISGDNIQVGSPTSSLKVKASSTFNNEVTISESLKIGAINIEYDSTDNTLNFYSDIPN